MPPPQILDLSTVDCDKIVYSREQIYESLPQRFEFSQLDAIVHLDRDALIIAGYRDIREDEWWCRGHLPQKPIFPGVLMLETAAQLAGFFREIVSPSDDFLGFGGVDLAKFRIAVVPPARVILIGRAVETRKRRFVCEIQAFVDGTMAFEGTITGIPFELRT